MLNKSNALSVTPERIYSPLKIWVVFENCYQKENVMRCNTLAVHRRLGNLLAVRFMLCIGVVLYLIQSASAQPGVNDPAPDFSASNVNGGGTFTLSDHAGKTVVIAFMGLTWCGPCMAEAPRLQNLWTQFQGHGVQFVVVSVSDSASGLQTQISNFGLTMPVVSDPSISTTYGISGVPKILIVDRGQVIRYAETGLKPEETTRGAILDVIYMREAVDTELVMDVSDSMNSAPPSAPSGDSKLKILKQAASMITDFLRDSGQANDRLGLVWFSDNVTAYATGGGQFLFPVSTHANTLKGEINLATTGTCTAMGGGLQAALETLSWSPNKRFVILCTDGIQNIEPKVAAVSGHYEIIDSGGWLCGSHSNIPPVPGVDIADYNAPIHTIGIGATSTYSTLLTNIANHTGGFYQATHQPNIDLDLIYFVDLTNAMAAGSPSIVLHSASQFHKEECRTFETFYLNRTARKVTAMLSWPETQNSDLTFWLHAPDGTRLKLHDHMKHYGSYTMATFHVPWEQDGQTIRHAGQWSMIITGDSDEAQADYHAIVIADDRDTKVHFGLPEKIFSVGEFLPIEISITEFRKHISQVTDITLETSYLKTPLAEQLSRYKVSPHTLELQTETKRGYHAQAALEAKLQAMEEDPERCKELTPVHELRSLSAGNLKVHIEEDRIIIPVKLDRPGLWSFKISVLADTARNGPIYRTGRLSTLVGPGRVDPKRTTIAMTPVRHKGRLGARLTVTPYSENGHLIGPGFGDHFEATINGKPMALEIHDFLNGTYALSLSNPKEINTPISISFQDHKLWSGSISKRSPTSD